MRPTVLHRPRPLPDNERTSRRAAPVHCNGQPQPEARDNLSFASGRSPWGDQHPKPKRTDAYASVGFCPTGRDPRIRRGPRLCRRDRDRGSRRRARPGRRGRVLSRRLSTGTPADLALAFNGIRLPRQLPADASFGDDAEAKSGPRVDSGARFHAEARVCSISFPSHHARGAPMQILWSGQSRFSMSRTALPSATA